MNREETIALFQQGREAWNAWAEKMLIKRKALEDGEQWLQEGSSGKITKAAQRWRTSATVDFAAHPFVSDADLNNFIFPADARFNAAGFKGKANFTGAVFEGHAWFHTARFNGSVEFHGATFKENTEFRRAIFKRDAGFAESTFKGYAEFSEATFEGHTAFEYATFEGYAKFRGTTFDEGARFDDVDFQEDARFFEAIINGHAGFDGVTFGQDARFDRVTFGRDALFNRVTFDRGGVFKGATFAGSAEFDGTAFEGIAGFGQCRFSGATNFSSAQFGGKADFGAAQGLAAFSLAEARFQAVPNFIQAHFSEAPRCDNLRIATQTSWSRALGAVKKRFKGGQERTGTQGQDKPQDGPDITARWRALKRLAIQGHDHEYEQIFFKNELLSRRWHADRPGHATFWFGIAYQLFGDFGRSLVRPLVFWILCVVVFAVLYLTQQPTFQGPGDSFPGWVSESVLSPATAPSLHCVGGSGSPVAAAFDLSVRNALLFVGQTSRDKLSQDYACLYGPEPTDAAQKTAEGSATGVPYFVIFMEHLQNVISAILLFLLLLAIRNHFRIK